MRVTVHWDRSTGQWLVDRGRLVERPGAQQTQAFSCWADALAEAVATAQRRRKRYDGYA